MRIPGFNRHNFDVMEFSIHCEPSGSVVVVEHDFAQACRWLASFIESTNCNSFAVDFVEKAVKHSHELFKQPSLIAELSTPDVVDGLNIAVYLGCNLVIELCVQELGSRGMSNPSALPPQAAFCPVALAVYRSDVIVARW